MPKSRLAGSVPCALALCGFFVCAAVAAQSVQSPASATGDTSRFDIPAQDMGTALTLFGEQSDREIVFSPETTREKSAPAVVGEMSSLRALERILTGSGLTYRVTEDGTIVVLSGAPRESGSARVPHALSLAERASGASVGDARRRSQAVDGSHGQPPPADDAAAVEAAGTPEILVKGARTLNTDIKRSEDAPQPYVVFERQAIEGSQAVNLEEFLRTRLPMNTSAGSIGQNPGTASTVSSINLRGLGANQTLILVDGRRMPGVGETGATTQADINGIPLAAVERIEVLPSTAGGIYGGSATGGVINIVLRRDYEGLEATATYANTFDADAASMRLDISAGFSLEEGRTRVMFNGAYTDAHTLRLGDRDFTRRGIALQLKNNRDAIEGASYPPLGATVNIRSTGGDLVLDDIYGGAALGKAFTHVPLGYAGPASDNGAALVANAGMYNLDLPHDLNGEQLGLLAAPETHSFAINMRREFGERVEAFIDLSRLGNEGTSYNAGIPNVVFDLPEDSPGNPFQQPINVRFPVPNLAFEARSKSTVLRVAGGLLARLPFRWTGEVDYGWSRSRFERVSTNSAIDDAGIAALESGLPSADGRPALNVLQEGNTFPIDFSPYLLPSPNWFRGPYDTVLKDATLRLSGPTVQLSGGPLMLSVLAAHRQEDLERSFYQTINYGDATPVYQFYPQRSQQVRSYYMEGRLPLISARNARTWVRELEVQASVRRDEYKTISDGQSGYEVSSIDGPFPMLEYATNRLSSNDYTLGVRFSPLPDVTLRASYGTGFLPPAVTQIAPNEILFPFSLGLDPQRGNTSMFVGVPFRYVFGGNPDLKPETSESWSAGVIFTPDSIPGLRFSADYTRIEKRDEIQTPNPSFLLANEDNLPGRIERGDNLASDPDGWAGPITRVDASFLNIASTFVEAYDFQLDYDMQTERHGGFHWYAIATWEPRYENRVLPGMPLVERVGFNDGPLEWRGNFGLNWDRGALSVGWNAQYYASYLVYPAGSSFGAAEAASLNQGSPRVPLQIYHDLMLRYRFDTAVQWGGGMLDNAEVTLGLQNMFDTLPPILAVTGPAGGAYSAYGDPRLRRYSISFTKRFGL